MNLKLIRYRNCIRQLICWTLLLSICDATTGGFASASSHKTRPSLRRVPIGTQMKVRLEDTINSKEARGGDRFRLTVLNPSKYENAVIEGHLSSVRHSGNFQGRTSMALALDRIRYVNGTVARLRGQVLRVYGEESAANVDEE